MAPAPRHKLFGRLVIDLGERLRFAEILDQPCEVGIRGFRVGIVLRLVMPEPIGDVIDQERCARTLHGFHQRLGLLQLYGFKFFSVFPSRALR